LRTFDLDGFTKRLRNRFEVEEVRGKSPDDLRSRLVAAGRNSPSFVLASSERFFLVSLRSGEESAVPGAEPLRKLDIAVLHVLVLEELLGIDRAAQEKQANLRYVKDFAGALEEARRGDVQAVFLLNPTAVAQLKAVVDAGEIMPQKSTYFFPKLASGLLIDPIDPAEEVPEGT
jgi:uncharacterized protein (DUF1015 family)